MDRRGIKARKKPSIVKKNTNGPFSELEAIRNLYNECGFTAR